MTRDLATWPIQPREKREALQYAIQHFKVTQPDISLVLQAVLNDVEAELKISAMRFDAGEGPST